MKVLIIKLSSIGDVAHTLPALEALRNGLRKKGVKARIDWLVEEAASGILEGNPLLDNVIVVRNHGWKRDTLGNLRAARAIARERYDMVIDFQGLLKSGLWVFLSKAKRRVGFSNARELSHIFLNEKLAYDPERHAVERYLGLAEFAGGDARGVSFDIRVPPGARDSVTGKLEKKGIGGKDGFFVIIPRARWGTKLWSDEKFSEFAKKAAALTGLKAVFAAGTGDRAACESMSAAAGSCAVSLAGEVGLMELAALFRLSRFAVTVDSGPMHIAAASGAKVAAIFGPTAPWRTGPYGKGHAVIRKDIDCSPCFKRRCPDIKCMKGISVEDVLKAVEAFLKPAK